MGYVSPARDLGRLLGQPIDFPSVQSAPLPCDSPKLQLLNELLRPSSSRLIGADLTEIDRKRFFFAFGDLTEAREFTI